MKINIKLGESLDDMLKIPEDRDRKMFPTFHIESDEKLDLPHSGTMTIKFKKTGFSMREDSDGDAHYSCTIEVHEVVDAYSEDDVEPPARNRNKEAGEALDALKANRKSKSNAY